MFSAIEGAGIASHAQHCTVFITILIIIYLIIKLLQHFQNTAEHKEKPKQTAIRVIGASPSVQLNTTTFSHLVFLVILFCLFAESCQKRFVVPVLKKLHSDLKIFNILRHATDNGFQSTLCHFL